MIQSLYSIMMIFLILGIGYLAGRIMHPSLRFLLASKISNIVLLLLFLMGIELGDIFTHSDIGLKVIYRAFLLSLTIALVTIAILIKRYESEQQQAVKPSVLHSVYGCLKAIVAFGLGVLLYKVTGYHGGNFFISSTFVLYIIVFLAGLDFVGFNWGKLTIDLLRLPLVTIVATLIAAGLFTLFSDFSWREVLLSASGFGWFSLSGPMVKALVTPKIGGMAFMTDFFREMFSILFLYFFGSTQPRAAIGLSGAAALDSALPFIKENCEASYIPYALVSGFILTLLSPFFIALAITLYHH